MQTEEILQTSDLQKLSMWRLNLTQRRKRIEALSLSVQQLMVDPASDERDWEAEADWLAQKIISIT